MSNITCPNCDTALSPSDRTEGWCDNCGKKLPAFLAFQRSLTTRRHLGWPDGPRSGRPHAGYWGDCRRANRPLASLGARLAGAFLDGVFAALALGPGYLLLFIAAEADNHQDQRAIMSMGLLLLVVCGLVLAVAQLSLLSMSGQSLGKKIVGTRVVNLGGSSAGFVGAVLLRSVVPGMIGGIPCIGPIFSLVDILCIFSEDRRCLHDLIAGTQVVEA
jgi:uncharacterized RDD family membrane protein YckC